MQSSGVGVSGVIRKGDIVALNDDASGRDLADTRTSDSSSLDHHTGHLRPYLGGLSTKIRLRIALERSAWTS